MPVTSDTITVYSRHKAPSAAKPASQQGPDAGQGDCGAADKIVADGHVYYVTPEREARGDHAVYTQADDQIGCAGSHGLEFITIPTRTPRVRAGPRARGLLPFAALQLGLVGAFQDDELDAPVLAPAVLVVLHADRLGLAVAVTLEAAR